MSFDAFVKRITDLAVSLTALFFLWPLLLLIAILIKIDSRGPVFFRQERASHDGGTFRIFKFRTMIVGAYRKGARLTVKRDPRITQVGGVLRWTKLDELPQLLNVILGDMALVGPRPEDPYFVNFYSEEHRSVLSVRPGLIGPSQMEGRDEVDLYPEGLEDTEKFYIEHILPGKLDRDLEYVRNTSVRSDLSFLVRGAFGVLASQFKQSFFARSRARLALFGMDLGLIGISYVLANFIHFDWHLPPKAWSYVLQTLFWSILLQPPIFIYYGLYQRTTRWVGRRDLAAIVKAVSLGSALVVAVTYFTGLQGHSRAVFIVNWAMLVFLMCGLRFTVRHILSRQAHSLGEVSSVRVLIAGSGHGGEGILRSLLEDPRSRFMPVGIIDHEPHRWGALIHGIRVIGGATDIAMAASTHGIAMVLVALADLDPSVVRDITEACKRHDIQYRLIPTLSDILSGDRVEIVTTNVVAHEGNL